jgi:hypothetical protein
MKYLLLQSNDRTQEDVQCNHHLLIPDYKNLRQVKLTRQRKDFLVAYQNKENLLLVPFCNHHFKIQVDGMQTLTA